MYFLQNQYCRNKHTKPPDLLYLILHNNHDFLLHLDTVVKHHLEANLLLI